MEQQSMKSSRRGNSLEGSKFILLQAVGEIQSIDPQPEVSAFGARARSSSSSVDRRSLSFSSISSTLQSSRRHLGIIDGERAPPLLRDPRSRMHPIERFLTWIWWGMWRMSQPEWPIWPSVEQIGGVYKYSWLVKWFVYGWTLLVLWGSYVIVTPYH